MTNKMRKEFEKWVSKINPKKVNLKRCEFDPDCYEGFTNIIWEAFKEVYSFREQEINNLKQINLELAEFLYDGSIDGASICGLEAQNKLEELGFIELVADHPESPEPVWEWAKGSQVSTIVKLEQEIQRLKEVLQTIGCNETLSSEGLIINDEYIMLDDFIKQALQDLTTKGE